MHMRYITRAILRELILELIDALNTLVLSSQIGGLGLLKRFNISLCYKTKQAQKAPKDIREKVQSWL
jgi:hypothetical protein